MDGLTIERDKESKACRVGYWDGDAFITLSDHQSFQEAQSALFAILKDNKPDEAEVEDAQADLELFYKLQAEDDMLKAAVDENKRLRHEHEALMLRLHALMAEKAEAIKQAKKYQNKARRLEKEL